MPINFSHPTFWGPLVWNLLHLLASQFKSTAIEDKQDWVEVLNHLPGILPCKECREHFRNYLKENPIDINTASDAHSLSHYLWKAHEHVNGLTGKKSRVTFAMLTKQLNIQTPQTPIYSQPLALPSPPPAQPPQPPQPTSLQLQKIQQIQQQLAKQIQQPAQPSQPAQPTPQPSLQRIRIYQTNPTPAISDGRPKSSGKPALRSVKPQTQQPQPQNQLALMNSKNSTVPQKQAPRAPKAVPLHVQKIIQAKRALEGQLQVNSEVKAMISAPTPKPEPKMMLISQHPSVKQQPKGQKPYVKSYLMPQNHKVSEGDIRKSLSFLMNSSGKRMPSRTIVPTNQQRNTIDKMAQMLQSSGVRIRGIVPSGPTTHVQPGIQPVVPKTVVDSRALPLALPTPLSVPRALTQSTPTRKKCNCGRK